MSRDFYDSFHDKISSSTTSSTTPGQQNPLSDQTPNSQQSKPTVSLDRLRPLPQWIECPKCGKTTQTEVKGRSDGMRKFMNVFWWPLPGREEWFEKTHWFCAECHEEVAMQKSGKDVKVLA